MTEQTDVSVADLYAHITKVVVTDPSLEQELLADLPGAIKEHFGVALPKPGSLTRTADGFRLTYDGQDYDLGDPRNAKPGELNDAELELVSGGDGNPPCELIKYEPGGSVKPKKVRQPIQPNGPSGVS